MRKSHTYILAGCLILGITLACGNRTEAAATGVQAYKQPHASSISKKNKPVQPKLVSPISKKKIYTTLLPHVTKAYADTENGLIKK
ncbi:hypothetical protein JQN58_09245 [Aneurinibacillus sp. BA2021]|nr:hypothetical protein [Aneurinibacillus sp. BA2021]